MEESQLARSRTRVAVTACVVVALAAVFSNSSGAQGFSFGGAAEKVSFAVEADRAEVRAGESVVIRVRATIDDGWHIYSMTPHANEMGPQPTTITIESDILLAPGVFEQPEPARKLDEAFGMVVESFEGEATFSQLWQVSPTASLGKYEVVAHTRFMVCDARSCLPPTTVDANTSITVVEGPARAEFITTPTLPTPTPVTTGAATAITTARSAGFVAYLLFAVSVGFLALLTPCVFPMIPITVSFFAKKEGLSRAQGLRRALIYCGGIIVTFTGLGIILALAFGAAAIQGVASNVWINLFIAAIFIVFAFNLFGAFEIRVPYQILNALGRQSSQGAGTVATLLMGLTFSLTSFTCTVPFVGTVLVAATQGELFWAITGMLGFSAAFSSPFFLLALFPQLLARLPRSGGWMNSVKVTMGFLELAAAMKFVSNIDLVLGWGVLPRELFLATWIAIALVACYYLLGKIQLPLDSHVETLGVPRLVLGVLFLAVSLYLFTGMLGRPLGEWDAFLPPYSMSDSITTVGADGGGNASKEKEVWLQNYDEALRVARETGMPIFVDFTGVTCTNCRWMEKNIFPIPEVAVLMGQYVRVQLWTDKANDESKANQEMQHRRFRTVALPFYALMSPRDEVIATFDGMTRSSEKFADFLRGGLGKAALPVAQM